MKRGDYVRSDYGDCYEYGRIASEKDEKYVFVCFSEGCTASLCKRDKLEVVEPDEELKSVRFGHHRFDIDCEDYTPEVCDALCPNKISSL